MTSLRTVPLLALLLALALAPGCNTETTSGTGDAGNGGGDSGGGNVDSGGGGDVDSGGGGDVDGGGGNVDSGGGDVDGGGGDVDSGLPACAGVECTGYADTLATQPRGATSIDNCVIQLHQTDCCGATAAYGINHGARTVLCAAETACVASYPDPICSNDTITTDTGETTMDPDQVRIRLVDGVCQTFVCTTDACIDAPGIEGGCG